MLAVQAPVQKVVPHNPIHSRGLNKYSLARVYTNRYTRTKVGILVHVQAQRLVQLQAGAGIDSGTRVYTDSHPSMNSLVHLAFGQCYFPIPYIFAVLPRERP